MTKRTAADTMPAPHRVANKLKRHGGLQDIHPERIAGVAPLLTAGDLHQIRVKRLQRGPDFSGYQPARICSATMPVDTGPAYPTPAHLTPARELANHLASRVGDCLHWPDGRVTDLKGFPLRSPATESTAPPATPTTRKARRK